MAELILCCVSECGKHAKSGRRGMCQGHYHRWYRYGNPNIVKKIPNGEARRFFLDEVLSYEGQECLIWPYAKYTSGYAHISFDGRDASVSRLVCEKTYGLAPTKEHEAAHSCGNGDRGCVTKRHLRWATPVENNQDKIGHGTLLHGEKAPWSKLSEEDVLEILSLKGQLLQREIAAKFNVTRHMIGLIHRGQRWSRLST